MALPDLETLVRILGALALVWFGIGKLRADLAAKDVDVGRSWKDYVTELRQQNAELKAERDELKQRLDKQDKTIYTLQTNEKAALAKVERLIARVTILEAQLKDKGITPYPQGELE